MLTPTTPMSLFDSLLQLALLSVMTGFAYASVMNVWLNGEIFVVPRSRVEAWREYEYGCSLGESVKKFFATLLLCPFCLSYHVLWPCWLLSFLYGAHFFQLILYWLLSQVVAEQVYRRIKNDD